MNNLTKNVSKKLFQYAVITSPMLSIYGIAPIYIFNILNFNDAASLFLALTIGVFIQWCLCIVIYSKINHNKKWIIYLLCFAVSIILHLPRLFAEPVLPFTNKLDEFFVYPFIVSIAVNVIILTICNSVLLNEKNTTIESENNELKIQNLEAQKQTLTQQLHPHFLFNSLSVLKSLIKENPTKAEIYSIKLSDFLRYSVESHKTDLVSLENELQFVNNYIELQKVRFENAFSFNVTIPSAVFQDKIPVFALQTLVENAFKHNYFTDKKPLSIAITYENGFLKVLNNKVSMKITERTSTGLANLNKRYQLFTGNGIEIIDTENNFCVTVSLIKE
jgi:two-component system, LytTR family, sensor kinase